MPLPAGRSVLTGGKVAPALELVVGQRGAPRSITVDNCSEFARRVMDAWACFAADWSAITIAQASPELLETLT